MFIWRVIPGAGHSDQTQQSEEDLQETAYTQTSGAYNWEELVNE